MLASASACCRIPKDAVGHFQYCYQSRHSLGLAALEVAPCVWLEIARRGTATTPARPKVECVASERPLASNARGNPKPVESV